MVTIGMNYRVRAGKESLFESAFQRVLEAMQGADGHDASELYRRVDANVPEYLIVSRWNSEAAFQDFVRSETFAKVTQWGLAHILEGRPRHTTYHEE